MIYQLTDSKSILDFIITGQNFLKSTEVCELNCNIFWQVSCGNADKNPSFLLPDEMKTPVLRYHRGSRPGVLQKHRPGHALWSNGSLLLGKHSPVHTFAWGGEQGSSSTILKYYCTPVLYPHKNSELFTVNLIPASEYKQNAAYLMDSVWDYFPSHILHERPQNRWLAQLPSLEGLYVNIGQQDTIPSLNC